MGGWEKRRGEEKLTQRVRGDALEVEEGAADVVDDGGGVEERWWRSSSHGLVEVLAFSVLG